MESALSDLTALVLETQATGNYEFAKEFESTIFRKVMPSDYKLFQVADFICTMTLIKLKIESNSFSKSELNFFGNIRDLKRNYLKHLDKKEFK